jgi:gas vesicle protein GvpL/GvpF
VAEPHRGLSGEERIAVTPRALAYCVFQQHESITRPATGVSGAAIQEIVQDRLRVLWSQVKWPFPPAEMQRHAVEFHGVVSQVFARAAVAPFPLLTIFDDRPALEAFVAARAGSIAADLERLRDLVQMECVLYVISEKPRAALAPELLQTIIGSATQVQQALAAIGAETRIREVNRGRRLFALVKRGAEEQFRAIVESVALPERISRRTGGPRPAAEFLSQSLKPL